ncbi:MAG: PASTA domain-containing protein [Ruminococcus sp.]|nr:PASTA domain-containing protein [Ruminococcus sp.]
MGERIFCYKCMEKYESGLSVCPHCGYDNSKPHDPMYIAPGTVLHDRYLVGILLEYNGEGATYAGHDISTGCKVSIREYMPINLCTRVKNKATISVNYNDLAKYKAFMAEYTELNKSLARMRNDSNINPVLDMFAENNTTYTVFEHIDGVKMLDYLKDNAGELSWEQVSKLFPPLFTTIGRLHNAGIIHRAISPDTVYITAKGELRLSGFCVSAVRTANAGLEYELFKGYAAPEQYSASSSSRQGSWTDVYGVCALIYRALTGCMPDDSLNRLKHDELHEPAMLNSRIPAHVSRVIMDGMNLSGRDRIQTITELVTRLFEQPAPVRSTAPQRNDYEEPSTRRASSGYSQQPAYQQQPVQQVRQPAYTAPPPAYPQRQNDDYDDYRYEKVNNVDRIKVPIIIGILLLAILMIIAVVIFHILGVGGGSEDSNVRSSRTSTTSDNVVSGTTDPSEEATGPKDTEVPNFKGKFYENIKEKWSDYLVLDPTYEYNDQYDSDMIFEQSIEAGTMVSTGTVVKVKVSKGKESATIPDFNGCTVSQYKSRLEAAGISDFNYQFLPSNSYYGTPNTVIELQVDGKVVTPGTFFSNKEGKKLTIYYVPEASEQQTTQSQWTETTTASPTEDVTQAPTDAPTEPTTQYVEPTTQYVEPTTVYIEPDPPVVDNPDPTNEYSTW